MHIGSEREKTKKPHIDFIRDNKYQTGAAVPPYTADTPS